MADNLVDLLHSAMAEKPLGVPQADEGGGQSETPTLPGDIGEGDQGRTATLTAEPTPPETIPKLPDQAPPPADSQIDALKAAMGGTAPAADTQVDALKAAMAQTGRAQESLPADLETVQSPDQILRPPDSDVPYVGNVPGYAQELWNGFQRGVIQQRQMLPTLAGIGAEMNDDQPAMDEAKRQIDALDREQTTAVVPTLGDIRWGTIHNLDDFMYWDANKVGEQIPILATMAAGGGVGAIAGKLIGAGVRFGPEMIKALEAGGAWIGATAGNIAQETAGTAQEQVGVDGSFHPLLSQGAGLVKGVLESYAPFKFLEEVSHPGFSIIKEAFKTGAREFSTEALQEQVDILARRYTDPNYTYFSLPMVWRTLESGMAGFVTGHHTAMVGGPIVKMGQPKVNPKNNVGSDVPVTREQMRDFNTKGGGPLGWLRQKYEGRNQGSPDNVKMSTPEPVDDIAMIGPILGPMEDKLAKAGLPTDRTVAFNNALDDATPRYVLANEQDAGTRVYTAAELETEIANRPNERTAPEIHQVDMNSLQPAAITATVNDLPPIGSKRIYFLPGTTPQEQAQLTQAYAALQPSATQGMVGDGVKMVQDEYNKLLTNGLRVIPSPGAGFNYNGVAQGVKVNETPTALAEKDLVTAVKAMGPAVSAVSATSPLSSVLSDVTRIQATPDIIQDYPELRQTSDSMVQAAKDFMPVMKSLLRRFNVQTMPHIVVNEMTANSSQVNVETGQITLTPLHFMPGSKYATTTDLRTNVALTLFHEIGHLVTLRSWNTLPFAVQQQAFLGWRRATMRNQISGVTEHVGFPVGGIAETGLQGKYSFTFPEYLAEQFRRWAQSDAQVITDLDKFYKDGGKKLQSFFAAAKDQFGEAKFKDLAGPNFAFNKTMDYIETAAKGGLSPVQMRTRANEAGDTPTPLQLRAAASMVSAELTRLRAILTADTKVQVSSAVEGEGGLFDFGSFDSNTRILRIILGSLAMVGDKSLAARVIAHEAFHSIQGVLKSAEFTVLAEAGKRLKLLTPAEVANIAREARINFQAVGIDPTTEQIKWYVDSEYAAAFIERKANGISSGDKLTDTIADRIWDTLTRIGNALRGLGFNSAESVSRAFYRGEMTRRYNTAQYNQLRNSMLEQGMSRAPTDFAPFMGGEDIQRGQDLKPVSDFQRDEQGLVKGTHEIRPHNDVSQHQGAVREQQNRAQAKKDSKTFQRVTSVSPKSVHEFIKGLTPTEGYSVSVDKAYDVYKAWAGEHAEGKEKLIFAATRAGFGLRYVAGKRALIGLTLPDQKLRQADRPTQNMSRYVSTKPIIDYAGERGSVVHRENLENGYVTAVEGPKVDGKPHVATYVLSAPDGAMKGYVEVSYEEGKGYVVGTTYVERAFYREQVPMQLYKYAQQRLGETPKPDGVLTIAGYRALQKIDPSLVSNYRHMTHPGMNAFWYSPNYIREQVSRLGSLIFKYTKLSTKGEDHTIALRAQYEAFKRLQDSIGQEVWNDPKLPTQFMRREYQVREQDSSDSIGENQLVQAVAGQRMGPMQDDFSSTSDTKEQAEQAANEKLMGLAPGMGAASQAENQMTHSIIGWAKEQLDRTGIKDPNTARYLTGITGEADRINKFSKQLYGLHQVAWNNAHLPQMRTFFALVKQFNTMVKTWVSQADETVRDWDRLPEFQRNAVTEFMFWLTEMSYRTPQEVTQGVRRFPTAAEFANQARLVRLSPAALQTIRAIQNDFMSYLSEVERISIDQANRRLTANPVALRAELAQIAADMAALRAKPYFPMVRFGQYHITVRNRITRQVEAFYAYPTYRERDAAARMMGRTNVHPNGDFSLGIVPESVHEFMGMPGPLIRMIKANMTTGPTALTQAQLQWLDQLGAMMAPERSFKKRWLNRKGTPGYSIDGMRVFASYFRSGSRYLARMAYQDLMQQQVTATADSAKVLADGSRRTMLANYMQESLNYIMEGGRDWLKIKSTAAIFYLGLNVWSAFVNLSQTPISTWSYLGGRFGTINASRVMTKNTKNMARTFGFKPTASPDYLAARTEAIAQNFIDTGQAINLGSYAESDNLQKTYAGTVVQRNIRKGVYGSMWMFARTEQANREMVFKSAYDLALEQINSTYVRDIGQVYFNEIMELVARTAQKGTPLTYEQATAFMVARDATEFTQGVYEPWARPPLIRGKLGGALSVFLSFPQMIVHQMINSPGKGKMMLVMLVLAGAAGFPGAEDLDRLIRLILRWSPWHKDFDPLMAAREYVRNLTKGTMFDHVGPDLFMHGISRYGFGLPLLDSHLPDFDASVNLGMGRLIPGLSDMLRTAANGGKWNDVVSGLAKDVGGAGLGPWFTVLQALMAQPGSRDWHTWTQMLPRGVAKWVDGARAWKTGADKNPQGQTIMKWDTSDPQDVATLIARMLGATPRKLSEKYEEMNAENDVRLWHESRKQSLYNQMNQAIISGEDKEHVLKAMQDYNDEVRKTGDNTNLIANPARLISSMITRAKGRAMTEEGLPASKGQIPLHNRMIDLFPGVQMQSKKVK